MKLTDQERRELAEKWVTEHEPSEDDVYELIRAVEERQNAEIERLKKALIGHRADLHCFSTRPCPTCRESAEALGIVKLVPYHCSRLELDEKALATLNEIQEALPCKNDTTTG